MPDPITDIKILVNDQPVPWDYVKIPVDLNNRAQGAYLYLCYTRRKSGKEFSGPDIPPITAVTTIEGSAQPPSGFTKIDTDLNFGIVDFSNLLSTSKHPIFLCYSREKNNSPLLDLIVHTTPSEPKPENDPKLYKRVSFDVNRKVGGDWILIYGLFGKPNSIPGYPWPDSSGIDYKYVKLMGGEHMGVWSQPIEISRGQIAANSLLIYSMQLKKKVIPVTFDGRVYFESESGTFEKEIEKWESEVEGSVGVDYWVFEANAKVITRSSYYHEYQIFNYEKQIFEWFFPSFPNSHIEIYQIYEKTEILSISEGKTIRSFLQAAPFLGIVQFDENGKLLSEPEDKSLAGTVFVRAPLSKKIFLKWKPIN
jgi:hypothetical protein